MLFKIKTFTIDSLRFAGRKIGLSSKNLHNFDVSGIDASDIILKRLSSTKPFLVSRIGATEFNCLSAGLNNSNSLQSIVDYIRGKIDNYFIGEKIIKQANLSAGIFPKEKRIIERFVDLTINDIKEIDILGIWLKEEYLLKEKIAHLTKIPLADIEPYYHKNPWSKGLQGKKVLVIHPFEKSIQQQFFKRKLLFTDPHILPDFELLTIKAVQTLAEEKSKFRNWFEALEHMKNQMDVVDYDVAIIGCGAYGLSLGAHAKRMGKQAIHMGGATQILFGIKGARWDNHPIISKLYNEHWVRPLDDETPGKKNAVEDGCYW
jgi:hypothetical protein